MRMEKCPAAIIEAAIAEVGTLGVFKDIRMGSRLREREVLEKHRDEPFHGVVHVPDLG